jgi:cobaltochelatase CobS
MAITNSPRKLDKEVLVNNILTNLLKDQQNAIPIKKEDLVELTNTLREMLAEQQSASARDRELLHVQISAACKAVVDIKQINAGKTIILTDTAPAKEISAATHSAFETILRRVKAKCNVLIVGPTQSGKTHLCSQVAEALGLEFASNSLSAGTKESDLFGWLLPTVAGGSFEYHPAPLVKLAETGGLWLADEMDAADSNLLLAINMLLANRTLFIPQRLQDQKLAVHPDFRCIAAANTWGTGADMQYVGRNQLDAATLARFVKVEVDYDPALEKSLFGTEICKVAHMIRHNIRKHRLERVMSTNHLSIWDKCLNAGLTMEDCLNDYFLGWSAEEKKLVLQIDKSI